MISFMISLVPSISSTLIVGSSDRRPATTAPAELDPTTM